MILGLANSLFRLFRDNSDVVPVSRLKRQGIREVTVLDWDRIEGLIARAVEDALSRQGVALSPEALASVNQEALEAFSRLVSDRDRLEASARTLEQEKAELSQNLQRLRDEVARSSTDLARERGRDVAAADVSVPSDALADFSTRLEQELRALFESGAGAAPGTVAELARRLMDEERARALEHARVEQRLRVESLERRVEKLKRTLSDTESVVERMQGAASAPGGIESIYREVQGLSAGDARAPEKKGLLDQIFQLNVELREVIDRGPKSA